MKTFSSGSLLIFFIATLSSCSSSNTAPFNKGEIYRNQTGILRWAGSPAVDGAGMLFIVDEVEYGAPGTPEDYSQFLNEDQLEVEVRADFKLTGEETVRGWGAIFPEIEFIKIEKY